MNEMLLFLLLAATPANEWPGFLGPVSQSLSASKLPLKWSSEEGIAWKLDLPGHAQSSPVVWDDVVYTTAVTGPEKNDYHLFAIDLTDGKIRWQKTIPSSDPVKNSVYVSRAAPTPVVDADGIYTFYESGDFVAYNHAGDLLWQRSLSRDYGKFQNEFGLAASPVLVDDSVIQLIDHDGPSYLLAVAKKTGETVWKTDRTGRRSWSSPRLMTVAGTLQIVVSSAGSVDGYDPATGQRLWTYTAVGGNTGTSPIPAGPGKVIISASAGQMGENAAEARKSNLLLEIVANGKGFEPRVVWTAAEATPSFGSPCVHQGYAYWVNRAGIVYCLDQTTGEQKYAQRIPQGSWATPVGIDDRVYFFGKDGLTTVLAAGPEFKILAENQLWLADDVQVDNNLQKETEERRQRSAALFGSRIQYGYAIIPGAIVIRTGDRLYCLR